MRGSMNVPAVAKRTFDQVGKESIYRSIVNKALKKLSKISQSVKRARLAHRMIDEFNAEVFQSSLVKKLSPCQEGCSFCCHTQVSVTADEAELLSQKISNGLEVDLDRLERQALVGNDSQEYFRLSFEDRRCVFLDEKGACRVYQDRPAVCRTNAVIGESSQCDTTHTQKPIRLVNTHKADMVIYAFFLSSQDSGTLPYMLFKKIQKINEEVG